MKSLQIILAMLLLGCCAVNAQPTNAINTNTPSMLTVEQAGSLSTQLANEEAVKVFKLPPETKMFGDKPGHTGHSATFVAGHWLWTDRFMTTHGERKAIVELASDGSTNKVEVSNGGWLP